MYFLVGNKIYDENDLTYMRTDDVYIVWKEYVIYDEFGNEISQKYVDHSFQANEIDKKSKNVYELVEVGDLILFNGNKGKPYPNGMWWIPMIATEDTVKNPSEYFEGWHVVKIYKPNKRQTSYHLAWGSE